MFQCFSYLIYFHHKTFKISFQLVRDHIKCPSYLTVVCRYVIFFPSITSCTIKIAELNTIMESFKWFGKFIFIFPHTLFSKKEHSWIRAQFLWFLIANCDFAPPFHFWGAWEFSQKRRSTSRKEILMGFTCFRVFLRDIAPSENIFVDWCQLNILLQRKFFP